MFASIRSYTSDRCNATQKTLVVRIDAKFAFTIHKPEEGFLIERGLVPVVTDNQ